MGVMVSRNDGDGTGICFDPVCAEVGRSSATSVKALDGSRFCIKIETEDISTNASRARFSHIQRLKMEEREESEQQAQ